MPKITSTLVRNMGLMEVHEVTDRKGNMFITLTYVGNMGNTVDRNVVPLFDQMYGAGSFAQISKLKIFEVGTADYIWCMKIAKQPFESAVASL